VPAPTAAAPALPTAAKPTKGRRPTSQKPEEDEEQPGFLRRRLKPILAAGGALLLLLIVLLTDSGEPRKARVQPVRGEVKFMGLPTPDAVVYLHPIGKSNPNVPSPRGIVKEDGSLVVGTYAKDDGAPPGEYAVTVQWFRKNKRDDEGTGSNALPTKYGDAKTSGLTVRVKPGEDRIPPIELKK
jgi:hypothetical protein